MTHRHCILIGAPVDSGQRRPGCLMGPAALRVAGIAEMLTQLGHSVDDRGDLAHGPLPQGARCPNPAVHALPQTMAWQQTLAGAGRTALDHGMPIWLGGDHSLSLGTLAASAAHALINNRPLFVLWLDAHSDFHTLESTQSGNLHGIPIAYAAGRDCTPLPPFPAPVPPANICLFGIRSVDQAEHAALLAHDITPLDMRVIDEQGITAPLRAFLDRVAAADGHLHVSLDVDFLDPGIAPAVGTTVPGGASFREAHLVMELLHESGLVTAVDLVELNPFLDERGRTAHLMVDLLASLMGRKVFDRPTRAWRGRA
ncbi:MAG: arginase [Pararhodobacter sp.]|nr:arginase [Pararhodobacter sp.]